MSFSSPITSQPLSTRRRTESEPTRPPEPVTIASGISVHPCRRVEPERLGQAGLVRGGPPVDIGERPAGVSARAPFRALEEPGAVRDEDGDVIPPGLRYPLDRDLVAGQLPADLCRLEQREAVVPAAPDVAHEARPATRVAELLVHQLDQVVDVEQIAHLLSLASIADVAQREAEVMVKEPEGEDSLVDLAHLPGPGDHPATVDHRAQPEARRVLLDQQLGGELGRPVEAAGSVEREVLGDARRGGALDLLVIGELEPG